MFSADSMNSMNNASPALHRYAMVCVLATLCLIFIGGLVTSTGSALAVPDWPLAFGHLVPKLVGGVQFEYGHRVAAGIVSILTLILALWTWRAERRSWVRKLAFGAFGLVIVQGILGGVTVLLELPLSDRSHSCGYCASLFLFDRIDCRRDKFAVWHPVSNLSQRGSVSDCDTHGNYDGDGIYPDIARRNNAPFGSRAGDSRLSFVLWPSCATARFGFRDDQFRSSLRRVGSVADGVLDRVAGLP